MSFLGTLLRPKPLPSTTKVTGCPRSRRKRSPHLGPRTESHFVARSHANDIRRERQWREQVDTPSVEDTFIRALVQVGSCSNCRASSNSYALRLRNTKDTKREHWNRNASIALRARLFSTTSYPKQATAEAKAPQDQLTNHRRTNRLGASIPRETYENLANIYDLPSDLWQQPRLSKPTPNHLPLAPRLVLTPEQESRPPYSERRILPPQDEKHANQLKRLKGLLKKDSERGQGRSKIGRMYRALPSPRPRYLTDNDMRNLLRILTWVEFKSLESKKLYFSVLDECLVEGVQLTAAEWNTAISFAGRWIKHTSTNEVKTAVETWMRMETDGVVADNVTFNVLFDVAIRAERFALADRIYEEMTARELPLNRYFFTSMIYYAGLRRNGDAVRQAFRQLVHAGEIVDTAIMNCVILSLIRAREPASAWAVFQNMKKLHAAKFGVRSAANWRERKLQGKRLQFTAQELRKEKEAHEASFFGSLYSTDAKREEAQRAAPIHPDRRTCEILLKHHTLASGNFQAVSLLLQDLKDGGWHLHGSVYFNLFGGFGRHGGYPGTTWKLEHLEHFWQDFLRARGPAPRRSVEEPDDAEAPEFVAEGTNSSAPHDDAKSIERDEYGNVESESFNEDLAPYFTPQLTISVLNAFYTCAGVARAREVWTQVQDKWPQMTAVEKAMAQDVVNKFTREDGMYIV